MALILFGCEKHVREHIAILVEFSNYSCFSLQTLKSGGVQEQWLTDLHYCFSVYITGHPQGPSTLNTVY